MGCFWGAERKFWTAPGVYSTAVGYAGGLTPNPTYEEVCGGATGHTEVVLVVFDPQASRVRNTAEAVLGEPRPDAGHASGQRHRNAVSIGNLLRPVTPSARGRSLARQLSSALSAAGHGASPRRSRPAPEFYYAEDYHQQYLAKNPGGYCGFGGTGVSCPIGLVTTV